jgi:hypothetical protein
MAKVNVHGASDPRAGHIDAEPRPPKPPDVEEPFWRYADGV